MRAPETRPRALARAPDGRWEAWARPAQEADDLLLVVGRPQAPAAAGLVLAAARGDDAARLRIAPPGAPCHAVAFAARPDRVVVQAGGFATVYDLGARAEPQLRLRGVAGFALAAAAAQRAMAADLDYVAAVRHDFTPVPLQALVVVCDDAWLSADLGAPRPTARALEGSAATHRLALNGGWCLRLPGAARGAAPRPPAAAGAAGGAAAGPAAADDGDDDDIFAVAVGRMEPEAPDAADAPLAGAEAWELNCSARLPEGAGGSYLLQRIAGLGTFTARRIECVGGAPHFLGDGSWLVAPQASHLDLYDLAAAPPRRHRLHMRGPRAGWRAPLVAANRQVAAGLRGGALTVWPLAGEDTPALDLRDADDRIPVALAANGRSLLTRLPFRDVAADARLYLLPAAGGRRATRLRLDEGVTAFCLGADGDLLYTATAAGEVDAIEVRRGDGRAERVALGPPGTEALALGGDGRALCCEAGRSAVWVPLPPWAWAPQPPWSG